jgi:hypothetical protein
MSKRKTIEVELVKKLVNDMLEFSAYDDDRHQQFRFGAITLLEEILHITGNYKGYGYLTQEDLLPDCRPGVNYLNGVPHPDYEERFKDVDNSRRVYN